MLVGSEASSITYVPGSSCHDQHAAPEDHPVRVQQPTGVSAPSTQAAAASMTLLGHMHDLASTEGPAPVSNNDCMSASFQPAMQLTEQKALTLPAATAVVMPMASTAAIPFLLARHRPASSQQPSSVCRQDMSGAARLMQANMSTGTSASSSSVAVTPPETAASTPQDLPKRHKKVFVHGNYKAYYGYRLGTELSEDPRLQVSPLSFNFF